MKRRGEELAISPPVSVVVSSDEEITSDSLISSSSFTVPMSKTWKATRDSMTQLLKRYDSNKENIAIVQQIHEKTKNLETVQGSIRQEADALCNQIQSKIEECTKNFSQEEQNLRQQQKHIADLENEVNEIRNNVIEAKEEKLQIQRKIEHYKEQANERVEQIDEVEIQKKEEVYRLQTQISLHAHTTGIRWDYDVDDLNVISGEIDIPSKQVQKRFCIDKENRSSFEVVNELWTMMEA